MAEQTLRELRLGIRTIDSELAHLLGRRMKLVRKIGKLKYELKMPVVDSAIEKTVVENFVSSASKAGVDEGSAKRIANLIIEGSIEAQRSMHSTRSGEPLVAKVAVIGAGGMGSWFARFFKNRGSHVTVSDRDQRRAKLLASKLRLEWRPSNVEAVLGSDVVILAVPMNAVVNVVNEILPVLNENVLLVDICAVKSPVMRALRLAQDRGVQVAGIHPMFGPLAEGIRGRKVVIISPSTNKRGSQAVRKLLDGANFLSADSRIHDKQTALTIALPHFLSMAFAMTLLKTDLTEIRKLAGRTFDMYMLLAENVASEPETAADIQIMNKEFAAVMRNLQRNIRVLAESVNRQDRTRLVAHYQQIQGQLSRDPELAREAFERACEAISPVSER